MGNATILLVEDNKAVMDANMRILQSEGYRICTAATLGDAREHLSKTPIDAVVLDIGLPDGNGLDFIEEIRAVSKAPVLLLTCLTERNERIAGLRAGGDDYISKPYDIEELHERIAAFIRRDALLRERADASQTYVYGELTLNLLALQVFFKGKDMQISGKEFAVLLMLLKSRGKPIFAKALYEEIWCQPFIGDDQPVKMVISRLRKKLNTCGLDIEAKRRQGYLLIG